MTKGFWGFAKELTTGLWGISKEVAKETGEAVKSYSENATVEAQKHRLEHFEKMKTFEKRAKAAGISEESLAMFIKDLRVIEEESEGRPSEPEGLVGLLNGVNYQLDMVNESLIETRFENYIKSFNNYKKMYKDAVVRGVLPDVLEEIFKDCRFTLSELEGSANHPRK
jgi:hypothetical protein